MLAKCANRDCPTRFLYLRDGKLFRIEIASDATPPPEDETPARPYLLEKKPVRHVEHFWLCSRCAESMTLTYQPGQGVIAVPIEVPAPRRQAAAS